MTFARLFSRRARVPEDGRPRPARRYVRRSRERGVAVVLVLGALTILTVMLTDFQDETSAELGSALSARDSLKAEYAARSAIQLSRLLIASEPTIRKALAPLFMLMGGGAPQIPVWEFADQVLGAFNDKDGQAKFSSLASVSLEKGKKLGMEGAGFDIDILDEDSKINLNGASRDALTQTRVAAELLGLMSPPQYDPLFTNRDGDGQYSDRPTVCGAILDWIDFNQDLATCDLRGVLGPSTAVEDSFYQLLDPPYYRKNAPLDSIEELHMVRGMSDDFWSTFIDPDPQNPKKRNVTVWGQGKINVNTANPMIILALICGSTFPQAKVCLDPIEQAKFLSLVQMLRMFTMGAPLFGSPNQFISTLKQQGPIGLMLKTVGGATGGLEPINFFSEAEVKKSISTESKVFSLIATGHVKSGKRDTKVRIHAVVDFRAAPPPALLVANAAGMAAGKGPLGAAGLAGLAGLPGAPPPSLAPSASGTTSPAVPLGTQAPAGAGPDADLAFLIPSPGGRIVYFRIE